MAVRLWYTLIGLCSLFWSSGGLLDHALVLVNLQPELANFRRFGGVGLIAAVAGAGGCGAGGVDLLQLLLDLGDISLGFDHVGVIVGIARLQLQQLRLQLGQFLFEGLRIGSWTAKLFQAAICCASMLSV